VRTRTKGELGETWWYLGVGYHVDPLIDVEQARWWNSNSEIATST
jgi:hypothetical protein